MRICFLLLALLGFASGCFAQSFQYTRRCEAAYAHFMALRAEEGYAAINDEKQDNPANLLPVFIEDYDDFFVLLLNGEPAELKKRETHLAKRLYLLDNGDKNDPMYRLCKGGLYLHWAIGYGRMGQNFQAATLFRKSYLLLKENKRLFPNFRENDVFLGLEETIAGSIPTSYKWFASIFGVSGNIRDGAVKLAGYLNNNSQNSFLYAEAAIYYCYVKFYFQYQQDVAWNYLNSAQFSIQNNLLNALVKANIALNFRKAGAALQTLQTIRNLPDYQRFPVLEYETAYCYFLKTDPACISHFQYFLKISKGSFFVKDAWQKMAYMYYMQGDMRNAQYCKDQIAHSGSLFTDEDKQADRFGKEESWPNVLLLKAHLLIDGGYYKQALEILAGCNEKTFDNNVDRTEYFFRLGRVYDELEDDEKAISFYQTTIDMGKEQKAHFAARSCLQMAFIYEKRGDKTSAVARYRQCLEMRHHDFQNSIDQQAKAGLNRLNVKE